MKKLLLLFIILAGACFGQTAPHWLQLSGTPLVSVDKYGAKGDGVTDDSAAFMAALKAGNGGIILTRGKTYKACVKASGDPAGAGDADAYVGSNKLTVVGNGAKMIGHSDPAPTYGIEYGYSQGFFSLNQFDSVVIRDIEFEGTFLEGFASAFTPPYTDDRTGPFSVVAGRYLKNIQIDNLVATQVPQLFYLTNIGSGLISNSSIDTCTYAALFSSAKDIVVDNIRVYNARFAVGGGYPPGGVPVANWTVADSGGTLYSYAPRAGAYGIIVENPQNVTVRNSIVYGAYSQAFRVQGSGSGMRFEDCDAILYARYGFAVYGAVENISFDNCNAYDYDPQNASTTYYEYWSGEPPATLAEAINPANYTDPQTNWAARLPSSSCVGFLPRFTNIVMTNCGAYSSGDKTTTRTRWVVETATPWDAVGHEVALQYITTTGSLVVNRFHSTGLFNYGLFDIRSLRDVVINNLYYDATDTPSGSIVSSAFRFRSANGMLRVSNSTLKGGLYPVYFESSTHTDALFDNCNFISPTNSHVRLDGDISPTDRVLTFDSCDFSTDKPVWYLTHVNQGPLTLRDCTFDKTNFLNSSSASGAVFGRLYVSEGSNNVMWGSATASATHRYWGVRSQGGKRNFSFDRAVYHGSDYDSNQVSNFTKLRAGYNADVELDVTTQSLFSIASPSTTLTANLLRGGTDNSTVYFNFPSTLAGWWYVYISKE